MAVGQVGVALSGRVAQGCFDTEPEEIADAADVAAGGVDLLEDAVGHAASRTRTRPASGSLRAVQPACSAEPRSSSPETGRDRSAETEAVCPDIESTSSRARPRPISSRRPADVGVRTAELSRQRRVGCRHAKN